MPRVRIVKVDDLNFEVQELKKITSKKKGTRMEWVGGRFFGHRLDHAAQFAVHAGIQEGVPVTPEVVKNAYTAIVEETRGYFENNS